VAAKFEIRQPKAGQFNWVLVSQGRTLATGEAYGRKVSAQNAIESLRKAAATATVADLTLPPAKTAPGKAARATGRAVGKAVVTAGTAVAKAEHGGSQDTPGRDVVREAGGQDRREGHEEGRRGGEAGTGQECAGPQACRPLPLTASASDPSSA